jgi:hypothetical protein
MASCAVPLASRGFPTAVDSVLCPTFCFPSLKLLVPASLRCHVIFKKLTWHYRVIRSREMYPVVCCGSNFVISQSQLPPWLRPEGELLQYRTRIQISTAGVL